MNYTLPVMIERFSRAVTECTPWILQGLQLTLIVSLSSIFIGTFVGLIACFMGRSNVALLRWISNAYVWVIRGTPMMVQGVFFFVGINQMVSAIFDGFRINVVPASIIVLSLNAGAYLTEIFRGGINAVPKGQTEAARSLGLSSGKTMRKVVLPQAVRIVTPSLVNQFIITIKDSTILSVIGLGEMMNKTKVAVGANYLYFESYLYLALWFLAILSILMVISKKMEAWMSYDRKN